MSNYSKFLEYANAQTGEGLNVTDPTLMVLTIDSSKIPAILGKDQAENIVEGHAQAVYEALPKTWTIRENYEDGSLFALKLVYAVGDGMEDWISNSVVYRLEHLDDVPLTLDADTEWFADSSELEKPHVLNRAEWDSLCQTLNSEAFKQTVNALA